MKNYRLFFAINLIAVVFTSCKNGDEEPVNNQTHILGHRGSGVSNQSDFQENTYESVLNAFDKLDGAEVDIQCSKNGTLWLFHNADLPENSQGLLCLPQSTDNQIHQLNTENPAFTITNLEEIFLLMMEMENRPFLSLDIKGYFNNGCFENTEQLHAYFDMMADGLNKLLAKYPLHKQIMIETDYQYFLDLIVNQQPDVETYLLGYNDFEKRIQIALEKAYDGISFNVKDEDLSKNDIKKAHDNRLKVQLWTVYSEDDFEKVMQWSPDFVQTGSVELGEQFIDYQDSQRRN